LLANRDLVLRYSSEDPRQHVRSLQTIIRGRDEKLHQIRRLVSVILEVDFDDTPIAGLREKICRFVETHRRETETDELSHHVLTVYNTISQGSQTRNAAEIVETCGICTSQIPWASTDAASCTKGHRFGQCLRFDQCVLTRIARCALTFGSIQRPGISKYCGICGKQYIDERKFSFDVTSPQQSPADSEGPEDASITLAQVVLSAANRCIYCGGKFIG
jgi:Putative zinc-finger of transcription factor IIIC complex